MVENLRDSRRKNEFIIGRRILIDIYKGEHEVRGKGKFIVSPLRRDNKKSSTGLSNGVIIRQGIKNKCHHHVKEPWTFCKA